MNATLSHSEIVVKLPRWEAVFDELKKLDMARAQQFKNGRYKEVFDFSPVGTGHPTGCISPANLATAYVENVETIEVAAEAVYAREGWLRPRSARLDFTATLVRMTGESAAHLITGITPAFESYLACTFGTPAVPEHPLMAKTDEDFQYIDAFRQVHPGLPFAKFIITSPNLESFGRAAVEDALGRDGIAIGSEVDDYLAAVAEWTGAENDYLTAVELARYCVLEDDIREYAENGISREYAALVYTAEFED